MSQRIDIVYNDCEMAVYLEGELLGTFKDCDEILMHLHPDISYHEKFDMDLDDLPSQLGDVDGI